MTELALRDAAQYALPEIVEGASVRTGRVSFDISSPLLVYDGGLVANREHACLHVAEVASFSVRGGAEVVVEPCADAAQGEIEAYLYGTVTALVLAQQGRFALHGSTIGINGATIAIAGRRGAGKTSTALALAQRGHELKGDDVLILDPNDGGVSAITTGRPVHVCADAAAVLGVDMSRAISLGPRIEKLAIPQPRRSPSPLTAIVALTTPEIDELRLRDVTGRLGFRVVHANTYRVGLLRRVWQPEIFAWASQVAASVPVHVLARPDSALTHAAVADCIERVAGGQTLKAMSA